MSTKLQSSFDALSRVIEQFESDGNTVRQVEATTSTTKSETGAELLTATISMPLSPQLQSIDADDADTDADVNVECERTIDFTPVTAELTDNRVCVSYTVPSIQSPETDIPVGIQPIGAEVLDGEVIMRIEVTIGQNCADMYSTPDASDAIKSHLSERGEKDDPSNDSTQERDMSWRSSESARSPPSPEGVFGGSVTSSDTTIHSADSSTTTSDTDECQTDNSGDTVESELSQVRDDSVPPYEDETYLQRLYEMCDTFSEMSDRIELDVAGETVRRYMIEAGVHSPTRYDNTDDSSDDEETEAEAETQTQTESENKVIESEPTPDNIGQIGHKRTNTNTTTHSTSTSTRTSAGVSADSGDEIATADAADVDVDTDIQTQTQTPQTQAHTARSGVPGSTIETLSIPDEQLVTDGAGLPSDLEISDIVDAVVGARTVYEVQRRLGIEYRQTRDLLDQLDILDLVLRRLSGGPDPDRGVSYEAIAARIQQCAQTRSDSETSTHTCSGSSSGVSAVGVDTSK